jgi:hypothetical protein
MGWPELVFKILIVRGWGRNDFVKSLQDLTYWKAVQLCRAGFV